MELSKNPTYKELKECFENFHKCNDWEKISYYDKMIKKLKRKPKQTLFVQRQIEFCIKRIEAIKQN